MMRQTSVSSYTSFQTINTDITRMESAEVEQLHAESPHAEPDSYHDEKEPVIPGTMRAIIFTNYGQLDDVVKATRIPIPKLTDDDHVLVKVLYASLSPVDGKIINGQFGMLSPRKPNSVIGIDFCGRVVEKGKSQSVRFLDIGQLVFGQLNSGNGSFAEFAICPISNLSKVPSNISPMEAAAIPLSSQTALQSLQLLKLKKSDKLLILGGGTSIGIAAIQIARNHFGCNKVDVTSSREEMCIKLGASSVVNYKEDKWFEVFKDHGFDAILDCIGGIDSWDQCRSEGVLKKNGRYATVVGDSKGGQNWDFGSFISTTGKTMNRKFWAALGEQSYDHLLCDALKGLDDVAMLVEDGKMKMILDDECPFAFAEWTKMFAKEQSGSKTGKLVIRIASDELDILEEKMDRKNGDDAKENEMPEHQLMESAIEINIAYDESTGKDYMASADIVHEEEEAVAVENDKDQFSDEKIIVTEAIVTE